MSTETITPVVEGADPAPVATPASGAEPSAGDPTKGAEPASAGGEPSGDDWRAPFATQADGIVDAKRLEALQRFSTPADYDKALRDTQTALRARDEGTIKLLGDDASDDDRAKFQTAIGRPESVDGYEITATPPEGLEVSDADKAFLSTLTDRLHKDEGFLSSPTAVNTAHQVYYEMVEEQAAQAAAQIEQKRAEGQAALKTEFGSDYDINMKYASEAVRSYFNADTAEAVLDLQLMDGSKIGDNPDFIKAMVNAGRATTEDPSFLQSLTGANGATDATTLDSQIDEIRGWMHGTPAEQKKYADATSPGGRLQQLMERRNRVSA